MTQPEALLSELSPLWLPPPKQTLSQWATENFALSTGADKGPFVPKSFQVEPLDAVSDPRIREIVIMSGTQLLKTTTLLVALAYVIAKDPDPVMVVQPRDADVQKFSKFRVAPMLRDVPALRGRVSESKSRDSQSTIDVKDFPGGPLIMTAAGSPGNLAAFPIRYLFCDEIDKYELSAGAEGDPISLARKRTATYRSRAKVILSCSPTEAGRSRIGKAFAASDQREFYVPCPHCGHEQVLKWGQVQWDKDLPREKQAESARYVCESCEGNWNDLERWRAVDRGRYIASAPFNGVAGFRISELCSPWKTLASIVSDFLEKKDDPQQLKTFVNTSLCELWKEKGESPQWNRLYERRERYGVATVPRGVLFLTAFVDVQDDRLEVELKGWGRNRECWSVDYAVIQPQRQTTDGRTVTARTSEPDAWRMLAEYLDADWPCEGGGMMPVWAMGIDTGYRPQMVYDFARTRPQAAHGPAGSVVSSYRTVVPAKGGDSPHKLIEGVSDTDAARKRFGLKIVTIGTHAAKQEVYDALRLERHDDGGFPAGYCHHPDYAPVYFQGLCAETRLVKASGAIEWRKDGRNEPLDCHVGNRVMAELCGIGRFTDADWLELERRRDESIRPAVIAPKLEPASETAIEAKRRDWIPQRNWFNR